MSCDWQLHRSNKTVCVTSRTGDGLDQLFQHTDEARVLRHVCEEEDLFDEATLVVDPFCGVGHFSLSIPRHLPVIGSDLSPRAIRFARINARLNLRRHARFFVADVRSPAWWKELSSVPGRPLVAANPPFGPSPHLHLGPHHSAAGPWGDDFLLATLRMAGRFVPRATIALLGLAFTSPSGRNSILERSGRVADRRLLWRHLPGEPFWRLGERHELTSPASLGDLVSVSAAHTHWGTAREWQEWAQRMLRAGFELVEYGVLLAASHRGAER